MAKWGIEPFMSPDDISANAVTVCLRTQENTLSFWESADKREGLKEAVLALATGPKSTPEKMFVLALSKEALVAQGLKLEKSSVDADTAVKHMQNRHYNLTELTLNKLSKLATLMASKIRVEDEDRQQWALFTKKDVVDIVRAAVADGHLEIERLSKEMRSAVQSASSKQNS